MFQRKNIVTSLDKNGPREEWPEVLRGYIEYISVKECNSGNDPVCSPVPREHCRDVPGQISK